MGAKTRRDNTTMKKQSHIVSIRLDEDQIEKLQFYGSEMGYSQSDLIRKMIEDADDVTMQQNQKINSTIRLLEFQKITEMKYQNYLLSNLTKNMNQVAHYLNKYKGNARIKPLLSAFQTMEKQTNEIKAELRGKNKKEDKKNGDH